MERSEKAKQLRAMRKYGKKVRRYKKNMCKRIYDKNLEPEWGAGKVRPQESG